MTDRPTNQGSSDRGGETPGGLPAEDVEDRPAVGTVTPEDYPDAVESNPTGGGIQSPPGLDEDKEFERRNPGS
jgi:hypothetical protein